jgi:hypothetical protein
METIRYEGGVVVLRWHHGNMLPHWPCPLSITLMWERSSVYKVLSSFIGVFACQIAFSSCAEIFSFVVDSNSLSGKLS